MKDISQRGQGFTWLQLSKAPDNSIYIVRHGCVRSTMDMIKAQSGDARNINVYTQSILEGHGYRLGGLRCSALIIDHAIDLTDEEYDTVQRLRARHEKR